MIGRHWIPDEYTQWNAAWKAPFGPPEAVSIPFDGRFEPQTAHRLGPFAFQPNNSTRELEYPWAFHVSELRAGMSVLEIGGALSGFQFALASTGAFVTNVDPF